jgi:ubiquinone/menaquinone biosynthesis C-methylase UbiE
MLETALKILKTLKWKILYYGDYNIGHRERQYWFKKALNNIKFSGRNILDAGCGLGDYSIICGKIFPKKLVFGLDISEYKIKKSIEKSQALGLKNVRFDQGDLLNLPQKDYFDFIFSIDVLEHIHEDEKVLKNLRGALKTGGYLYVHVPIHVKKYYFNRFRHKFVTHDHVIDGYQINDIKSKLMKTGFAIQKEYETHRSIARLSWEIYGLIRSKRSYRLILRPFLDFMFYTDRIFPYGKISPAGLGLVAIKQ